MSYQLETISLEELVPADHCYSYFKSVLTEAFVSSQLCDLTKVTGRTGYGIERLSNIVKVHYCTPRLTQ